MAPTPAVDGTLSFKGGQNAAIDPAEIDETQYFLGNNVSAQSGSLRPRWGNVDIPLDFSQTGTFKRASGLSVSWQSVFETGKFQAFIPYSIGPDYFNLYLVSGYIFVINLSTAAVGVLNPTDPVNVETNRINSSDAAQYLIIFDFSNRPFILEGIEIRRSDTAADEVPISVLGAYNQNRLVIANAGLSWLAGDPAGSTATLNAPITFTELLTPSSPYVGDVYDVPTATKNISTITAMGFLQVLDKSTQIGSLLVATQNAIYSYPTFLPRAQWQGGADGAVFGSLLLAQGIVGQRAQVNVNSDFLFKSPDRQIYAFTMARNQQYRWSNSAISREVNVFLDKGDGNLEFISFATQYKNHIFFSCYPYRVLCQSAEGEVQFDYVSRGIVVIEIADAASLSQEGTPIWAGVWTGVEYLDMCVTNQVLYLAAKVNGRNKMFRVDPEKTYDVINGKEVYFKSTVVTKEYVFKDPTMNKELQSLELGLRKVEEKVSIDVEYSPDTTDNYFPWNKVTFDAPVLQCSLPIKYLQGLDSQGVRDLNIGGTDQSQCTPNKIMPGVLKGVQIRLSIRGRHWEIKYVKVNAVLKPEPPNNPYCTPEPVEVPNDCYDFWELEDGC